ncbi:MAG: S-layer homology domain-containing protein [Clostridia bacterium]|nr:S-layer homology domain-containing protein [Clostridia bacterium]
MNKKKLVTVLLLILIMLCGITAYAEANETDPDYIKGTFYMEAFGIDTGELTYNSPVSRGFAANAVSKTLFDELVITPAMTKFADVPPDSPYASAAYLLSNSGIMQGDGTNFNPENDITYSQAAKIFVASLGKTIVADTKGGYPAGYIAVASSEGIFDGVQVKSDDTLTFGDFAKMYRNFTECKGFVLGGDSFGTYSQDDTTVIEHKMYRQDMMYIEGVVTGNQYGSVTSDDMGQISIENVTYDLDCEVESDIIGYYADVFLTKKGSKYVVTSIIADPSENRVKRVPGSDLSNISLTEIKYYDENDREKSLKLSDVAVVRNGKIMSPFTKEDLVPLNGGIVLIDNNSDNKYEYVYVENKQYYTVQRTSAENNVVVLDDGSYEGSTHLYINPDDDEYYHRIYNSEGEPVAFSDIKAEDVLRIEGSTQQHLLRVYIIDNVFDGAVEKIAQDDDYPLTVEGKSYKLARNAENGYLADLSDINFNSVYTFTVDGDFVVKVDKVKSDAAYAYVINTIVSNSLAGEIKYQLVSDDKQVYEGELADKIVYNGSSMSKEKFTPKSGIVISYRIDSDGKICYIDDAELHAQKESRRYAESTGILYSNQAYEYPLFMSDETVVFVVPDSGKIDDYMADLSLVNDKLYDCAAYDYNDDNSSVSVVVIYDDVTYESQGYIYAESPICILKQKQAILDEDNDSVFKLTWLEGAEEKSAIVKDTDTMNRIVKNMAIGDVFQYSVTTRGYVDNINTLIRLDQNPSYFHNGANSNLEQVFGKVVDAEYKTLPKGNKAKFVNVFTLDTGASSNKNFLVTSDDTAVSYYYYDSSAKTVKAGSFDDVMTEDGVLGTFSASEVFIYYYTREALAVVIKN